MPTLIKLIAIWSAAIGYLVVDIGVSVAAVATPPTSLAELLQNARMAGDKCLLLDNSTYSAKAMLQLFGAQDAVFFGHGGQYAKPEDFTDSVQVRAGDFSTIRPKLPFGGSGMQLVGQSGSQNASLRFVLSALSGANLSVEEAETAFGTKLSYVKLPPVLGPEGTPFDPSYYLLERTNSRCSYHLQIHYMNRRLDNISLKEERL
jgi:hypothetical protein